MAYDKKANQKYDQKNSVIKVRVSKEEKHNILGYCALHCTKISDLIRSKISEILNKKH